MEKEEIELTDEEKEVKRKADELDQLYHQGLKKINSTNIRSVILQ